MTRNAWVISTLVGTALLASACGGQPTSTPAPSSASSAPASSPAVASPTATSASASPEPSAGVSVPADSAKIGDSIQYDDKVEVTITQFENSGERTTLTVEIDNRAAEDIDGPVDVQASYGSDHLAAEPVASGKPISVPVKAGEKSSGTYVFSLPKSGRSKVAVDVALGTDRDHAQFLGSVR